MIRVRELEFSYPDSDSGSGFRLQVGKLEIGEAEHVAFTGPSGCGKTTLAHLIAGIHTPTRGEISVGEHALHALRDRDRRNFRISEIGFIFQEFALLDYLNVEENILLPFFVNSSLALNDRSRDHARALAGQLGLGEKLARRPAQLSGGEKQRVAIGRALVTNPSLIIADEPTGNLDPETSSGVTDLIHSMAEKSSATFIMVTHDRALLERFDRTIDIGEEFGS